MHHAQMLECLLGSTAKPRGWQYEVEGVGEGDGEGEGWGDGDRDREGEGEGEGGSLQLICSFSCRP